MGGRQRKHFDLIVLSVNDTDTVLLVLLLYRQTQHGLSNFAPQQSNDFRVYLVLRSAIGIYDRRSSIQQNIPSSHDVCRNVDFSRPTFRYMYVSLSLAVHKKLYLRSVVPSTIIYIYMCVLTRLSLHMYVTIEY